jgi:peptidoglycan/xylan/chitin deacetylase (PgdA/CDA1 family)
MIDNGPGRLLVGTPDGWAEERAYVLHVVLTEWLGLEYDVAPATGAQVTIRRSGDQGEIALPDLLFATSPEDWLTERSMPARPLARASIHPAPELTDGIDDGSDRLPPSPIPVVFGAPNGEGSAWLRDAGGLALSIDVFGSVFFLLTRYEEVVRPVRDRHDRFPASASLAAAEGFLDRPLADEYVDILWMAMRTLWPGIVRRPSTYRLRLTHDIDEAWAARGRPVGRVVRALAGDALRRRDVGLAARRFRSLLDARVGRVDHDPYNTFDFLMDTSERHDIRTTFYVVAGRTDRRFDGHYELSDPLVGKLLRRIHDRGHEVGLHPSYGAYLSAERTQEEFDLLRAACSAAGFDQPAWGVRQHYLRFENPTTWRIQETVGFEHDSTIGFADHVGFRAGTCREYPVFDLLDRRRLALRERPLLVMDVSLFDYMAAEDGEAADRVKTIIDACRRQRGDAVLLFHNNAIAGGRRRAFYEELVSDSADPIR